METEELKELLGKEVLGFKFRRSAGVYGYAPYMDNYIGVVGKIAHACKSSVIVQFPDGNKWVYPTKKAKEHLVSNSPEIFQIL